MNYFNHKTENNKVGLWIKQEQHPQQSALLLFQDGEHNSHVYAQEMQNFSQYFSFCTLYLPVTAAAMNMAGNDREKEHSNARGILMETASSSRYHDDFFDRSGDPSVTRKIGTNIQDNKCSWFSGGLVSAAGHSGTAPDLEELWEGGRREGAGVKALCEDLDLPGTFLQYREDGYKHLMSLTQQQAAPSSWCWQTSSTCGKGDLETTRTLNVTLNHVTLKKKICM